jgi:hypothetical protein
MDPSLQVISILKALVEIAGVAFLGQGVLWLVSGSRREQNIVYRMFRILTSPVTRFTRMITPRVVLDQHIGLVAFFLLVVAWVVVLGFKVVTCSELGYPQIRPPGC